MVSEETETGTGLVSATETLAHYISQTDRLEIVTLALDAAQQYAEYDVARGLNRRRGPRGAPHLTRLSTAIGVHTTTIKKWINGEEPSDASLVKLLRYLHDFELPGRYGNNLPQRLRQLIEADLEIHQTAVMTFLDGIEKTETGTSQFAKQTGGEVDE